MSETNSLDLYPRSKRPIDERKRILGIYDLHVSPISLGGLLILAEELQFQRRIHMADYIDVCVVGDAAHLLSVGCTQAGEDQVTLLDSKVCKDSAFLSALLDIEGIHACYLSNTIAALQDFLCSSPYPYVTWPTISEQGPIDYTYNSTIFVQKFYRENGFLPYLSCQAELVQWAVDFIQCNVQPYLPVVVHLKNNPNEPGSSNADFDAWLTFFKDCYQQYDVMFILIGNEEIDQRVRKLPNILVARDSGSNLSRDLALIQTAFMFMGMASGPCNMAVFSDIPYAIYKNPDHHAEQTALELGGSDQFPFATPFQKVMRVLETTENLMAEFVNLYTHVNRQDWEKRLANLR